MTVAELIKILQECPPNYEVYVFSFDETTYVPWEERFLMVLDDDEVIYV